MAPANASFPSLFVNRHSHSHVANFSHATYMREIARGGEGGGGSPIELFNVIKFREMFSNICITWRMLCYITYPTRNNAFSSFFFEAHARSMDKKKQQKK